MRAILPTVVRPLRTVILVLLAVAMGLLVGCGAGEDDGNGAGKDTPTSGAEYPDVVKAELTDEGSGSYTLEVTISSEYDTPERYADGWRVLAPDGEELGTMTLGHDHASEQPFTRSQSGLEIPEEVDTVTVEGRDLANGYGGATRDVEVPRS
ncbi:MAG: hypothetical protein L0H93_19645 [Nocardioides sp.]|nr:hypothetical protein [Nocardioides sp.]